MPMPLTMAREGENNTVKKVGGKDETRHFLASMGFLEGASVTVVSRLGGSLIVRIKDTRVALSSSMANRILV